MTEAQWLAENSPSEKLRPTKARSDRKLRLLAVACCHRIWHLIPVECHSAISTAERFADGQVSSEELRQAHAVAIAVRDGVRGPSREYRVMVKHAAEAVIGATMDRYDMSGPDANPERLWFGGALVAVLWHAHIGASREHKSV